MPENYRESGQGRQWEFKLPDLDLDRILRPDRYEAKQELPVVDFQEPFLDKDVPKEARVQREDFAAFAGGIISANPELIEYAGVGDEYGRGIARHDLNGEGKFIDINYLDCSDGVKHNIAILVPKYGNGEGKFTSYSSGNGDKDKKWTRRQDSPVHAGGEQFFSFVAAEEIRALGNFIETEFGLNVPEFEPENYKEI